jgi:O-antigen/teichoic acid export membrane protein
MFSLRSRKNYDWFSVEHLTKDIKGKSIRGGVVIAVAQAIQFVLRIGSMMVLARLLLPAEFGLIAMVTAVTNFAMMFRDLGLSLATIQQKNISQKQVSNLFWVNTGVGFLLAFFLILLAPVIAKFYGDPRLIAITQGLAVSFVFSGLGVQHKALLQRQMKFVSLGFISTIGTAAGVIAAIIAVLLGAGYWSLVVLAVVTEAGMTLSTLVACPWIPSFPRRNSGTRPLLSYGGNVTGFGIVNYFARNLDNILIGKFCGSQALGLYTKAYYLMMLPVNQIRVPIQSVAMPALSLMQGDPIQYRKYYLTLISLLAFVTMPLSGLLFVISPEVINLILGPNWKGSTNIFQILCFVALLQPVSTTRGLVLLSLDQSDKLLKFGVCNSACMVVSFVVGLPGGAEGVALAYTIANYVILVPSLWYCFRESPITIVDFFANIARPFGITILMAVILLRLRTVFGGHSEFIVIGSNICAGGLIYVGLWLLIPGGVQFVKKIYNYRLLLKR